MLDNSSYARRYGENKQKDRSSGYSSKVQQISLAAQPRLREPLREKSGDSKLKTKENSLCNARVDTISRSSHTIVPVRKEHRKQLSKPVADPRNDSAQSKYATRRHSRLSSEVTTASTTVRRLQEQCSAQPSKTDKDESSRLAEIFERVSTVLEDYKQKEEQWKKDKRLYEKKIELLVNQLARSERLR